MKNQNELLYMVEAYNYGKRLGHRYTVGIFATKEEAIKAVDLEETSRSAKYSCVVFEFEKNSTDGGNQIYASKLHQDYLRTNKLIQEKTLDKIQRYDLQLKYLEDLRRIIKDVGIDSPQVDLNDNNKINMEFRSSIIDGLTKYIAMEYRKINSQRVSAFKQSKEI
jgi:hypothetical protein